MNDNNFGRLLTSEDLDRIPGVPEFGIEWLQQHVADKRVYVTESVGEFSMLKGYDGQFRGYISPHGMVYRPMTGKEYESMVEKLKQAASDPREHMKGAHLVRELQLDAGMPGGS